MRHVFPITLLMILPFLIPGSSTSQEISLASDIHELTDGQDPWVIEGEVVLDGENYTVKRSIIIVQGGNLTIINSVIQFNSSYEEEFHLGVNSGGYLDLRNSRLERAAGSKSYNVTANNGSTLRITNSTISQAGYGPGLNGFTIRTSDFAIINSSLETIWSIRLEGVRGGVFSGNTIFGGVTGSQGLVLVETCDLLVENNTFQLGYWGIRIINSTRSSIIGNKFKFQTYGLDIFRYSNDTTVMLNSFDGCLNGLIVHNNSKNSFIFMNDFSNNLYLHALDDGINSKWDNGYIGNRYDNYNGTGVYTIPGRAGAVDHYPMNFTSNTPSSAHVEIVSPASVVEWPPGRFEVILQGIGRLFLYYIEPVDLNNRTWLRPDLRQLQPGNYIIHAYASDLAGNFAVHELSLIIHSNSSPPMTFSHWSWKHPTTSQARFEPVTYLISALVIMASSRILLKRRKIRQA